MLAPSIPLPQEMPRHQDGPVSVFPKGEGIEVPTTFCQTPLHCRCHFWPDKVVIDAKLAGTKNSLQEVIVVVLLLLLFER